MSRYAAALAIAALLMTPACGRQVAVGVEADPAFVALDANGDGKVSLEESQMAVLAFNQADRNGDGALDVLEWQGAGDASGIVGQRQRDAEDRRDTTEPHRTGNTIRGVN